MQERALRKALLEGSENQLEERSSMRREVLTLRAVENSARRASDSNCVYECAKSRRGVRQKDQITTYILSFD